MSGLCSKKDNIFLEANLQKKEPFHIFEQWFNVVREKNKTAEARAMCVATATKSGIPSARIIILDNYSKKGFTFFTHYSSRKGEELEENPIAALCFYWNQFNRMVRVEGTVEKLPLSDADEYFIKRPYSNQIGTLSSQQSKQIEGRHVLLEKEEELKNKYPEGQVPRPPEWGGYLVKPHSIEFWQGQSSSFNDRIRFRRPRENEPDGVLTHQGDEGWIYERLAP